MKPRKTPASQEPILYPWACIREHPEVIPIGLEHDHLKFHRQTSSRLGVQVMDSEISA